MLVGFDSASIKTYESCVVPPQQAKTYVNFKSKVTADIINFSYTSLYISEN